MAQMNFIKTKGFAWLAFIVVLVILVCTFTMRTVWWAFIDIFFMFMAAFINLVAVTVRKVNPHVADSLNKITLIMLVCWVLSLIGEWIAFEVLL